MKILKSEIDAIVHQERDDYNERLEIFLEKQKDNIVFRKVADQVEKFISNLPDCIVNKLGYGKDNCRMRSVWEDVMDAQVENVEYPEFSQSKLRDKIILAARSCDTLEELQVKIKQQ